MVCFSLRVEPVGIGMVVFLGSLTGAFICRNGLYVIPGLPAHGTAYSYINGFGVIMIAQIVVGLLLVGWQGVAALYVSSAVASGCNWLLESRYMKKLTNMTGIFLTGTEGNFFNACRLHACRLGITTDIVVTDDELCPENWRAAFEQLASRYPEVVVRWL